MFLLVLLKKTLQFLTFSKYVLLAKAGGGIGGELSNRGIRLLNKLPQEQLRHKDRKYLLP